MEIAKSFEQQINDSIKELQFNKVPQVTRKFVTKRRIGETVSGCDSCGFLNNEIFYGKGRKLTIIGNGGILETEIDSSVRQCLKTDDGIIVVLNNIIEIKGMIEGKLDGFFECIATDGLNIFIGSPNGIFSLNKSNCELNLIRKGHYFSIQIDKERMKIFGLKNQSVDIFSIKDTSFRYENSISFPQIALSINVAPYPFLFGVTLDDGERLIYADTKQKQEPIMLYDLVEYPNSSWCFGTHSIQYNVENDSYRVVIGRLIKKDNKLIEEIDNSIDINQPVDIQSEIKKSFIGNEVILKIVTTNEVLELCWDSYSLFVPTEYYSFFELAQQPMMAQVLKLLSSVSNIREAIIKLALHFLPNKSLSLSKLISLPRNEIKRIIKSSETVLCALKIVPKKKFESYQSFEEQLYLEQKNNCSKFLIQVSEIFGLINIYSSLGNIQLLNKEIIDLKLEQLLFNNDFVEKIQEMNSKLIENTKNYELLLPLSSCGKYFNIEECLKKEIESNVKMNVQKSKYVDLISIDVSIGKLVIDILFQMNKKKECYEIIQRCENKELTHYLNEKMKLEKDNILLKELKVELTEENSDEKAKQLKERIELIGQENNQMSLNIREKKLFECLFDLQGIEEKTQTIWKELKEMVNEVGNRISKQKKLIEEGVIDGRSDKYLFSKGQLEFIEKNK